MGYVAVITVGVIALAVCGVFFQILRLRERAWERKEQVYQRNERDLLNRIMYLVDRPYEMPSMGGETDHLEPPLVLVHADLEPLD